MKKTLIILFTILLCQFSVFPQSPKRELRSAWLTTVWGIDWPATVITSSGNTAQIESQKQQMTRILDSIAACNMNAVYFQVRSRCDAMYKSSYEPWSTDLVASRGMEPGYDPLAFVVEECHKRGLEVHAWLNPYRYESVNYQWTGLPGDYRTSHPEWILTYSKLSILDPGRPQVIKQIKNIVGEIVNKYDVDGIIFDDYFYAYGGTSSTLDAQTQSLYKPAAMDLGDWRRANVNKMVSEVYDTIQTIKPYIKFGVSPFGIWTTSQAVAAKEGIALPAGITGGNMYAEIYCDPVAWLKEGTVDYISPQLYWPTTSTGQDYDVLCPWWSQLVNKFNKHFYSSQTLSGLSPSTYAPQMRLRMITKEPLSMNALSGVERMGIQKATKATTAVSQEEIGNQIARNRLSDINNAPGSVFFSAKPLYTTAGFTNYLRKNQFTQKALTPAIHWKNHTPYGLVTDITLSGNILSWNQTSANLRYSVYAIPNDKVSQSGNFTTSMYLLGTAYTNSFILPKSVSVSENTFAVAVLDRYGNEFPPQIMNQPLEGSIDLSLTSPSDGANVMLPFDFKWQANTASFEYFIVEIAEDNSFTKLIGARELTETTFSTNNIQALQDGRTYYWRVKTRKANAADGVSEVRNFTIKNFAITNPLNGSVDVSLTPSFEWSNVSNTAVYTLEIAINNDFSSVIYSNSLNATNFTIPEGKLVGNTVYYARVRVTDGSLAISSKPITFTTANLPIPVPQITKPTNGENISTTSLEVCWSTQNSNGFRIELSENSSFPPRGTTVKTADAYTYCVTYDNLTIGKIYYIRAFALTLTGMTSASPSVMINLTTGVNDTKNDQLKCFLRLNSEKKYDLVINTEHTSKAQITLYSLTGTLLWNKNTLLSSGENRIAVDINNLPRGIYPVIIQTEKEIITLKLKN